MAQVRPADKGRIPISLHNTYQRYKAGTTTIIDWLVKNGSPRQTASTTQQSDRLPVRKILELAYAVTERKKHLPGDFRSVYKSVLFHRRALTKYFDQQHNTSEKSKESTDCHKHFNDILARAYDVLFPVVKSSATVKKKPVKPAVSDDTATSSNRFDTLSDMIEQEPDFDSAYVHSTTDASPPTSPSKFVDDPLEEPMALHAYVLEVEGVINLANETWAKAVNGDISLTVAGTLTNFAYQQIRYLCLLYGPRFGYHPGLFELHSVVKLILARINPPSETSVAVDTQAVPDFRKFVGLSQHQHLEWPFVHIGLLLNDKRQNNSQWLKEKDDCKLRDCLRSPDQEFLAEEQYQRNRTQVLQRVKAGSAEDTEEIGRMQDYSDGLDHRFKDEVRGLVSTWRNTLRMSRVDDLRGKNLLLQSFRGQGTAKSVYQDFGHDVDARDVLLHPADSVPMLMDLEYVIRHPDAPLRSELGFGINLLTETSKAFHWQGKTFNNVNCRIKALALAGEVLDSIKDVCKIEQDELMATAHTESDLPLLSRNMCDLLTTYRSTRRFGLYHQSPWVGGGDMSAVLGKARIDSMASRTEDRLDPLKISVFVNHFYCGARLDPFQFSKLAEGKNIKLSRNSSEAGKCDGVFNSFTEFSQLFRRMEALLEADFSGPLPIATLNCFKAYKMCLEVWKIISLHYMAADGSGVPLEFADFADLERDAYVRNIHSSSFYHLTSASIVDKMMKTAKKDKVDFRIWAR